MASKHDQVAERIAEKLGAEYNPGKGVDIVTSGRAVEVETESTIGDAKRQLQGHKKPSYVAVTNKRSVDKALDAYKDTTIGVMDPDGNIVKRSSRKRR